MIQVLCRFCLLITILFTVNISSALEGRESLSDDELLHSKSDFKIGILMGTQQYTGAMSSHLDTGITPGLSFSYNFNSVVSLQLSFIQSQSDLNISTPNTSPINGSVGYTSLGFHGKFYFGHYLGTQDDIDPYFITGVSQNDRLFNLDSVSVTGADNATAFEYGGGLEFPVLEGAASIGFQALYRMVNYRSESQEFVDNQSNPTGVFLSGDEWTTMAVLGINI